MNKFIFGLGAALLALVLTGDARADGNHGHGGNRGGYSGGNHGGYSGGNHGGYNGGRASVVVARPYYLDHGVRYNGGYVYRGQDITTGNIACGTPATTATSTTIRPSAATTTGIRLRSPTTPATEQRAGEVKEPRTK